MQTEAIITDFTNFINQFKVFRYNQKYNISRIGYCPNKYYISDEMDNVKFFNKYIQLYSYLGLNNFKIPPKDIPYIINFSQRQQEIGPLMLNIDFKFDSSVINKNLSINELKNHKYTEDDIKNIVLYINSLLHKYFNIKDDEIYAYLQEKPYTSIYYDNEENIKYIKDGFHLCYIYPFTIKQRIFIINKLYTHFSKNKLLDHIGFTNAYDDIFDKATVNNNWMIYGSYKSLIENDQQIYKCEYYYDIVGKKYKIDLDFNDLVKFFDVCQFIFDEEHIKFKKYFLNKCKFYNDENKYMYDKYGYIDNKELKDLIEEEPEELEEELEEKPEEELEKEPEEEPEELEEELEKENEELKEELEKENEELKEENEELEEENEELEEENEELEKELEKENE